MPFKKYISIIIKIVIVFFSFFFIHKQLTQSKSFNELDYNYFLNSVLDNYIVVLIVFMMMILNWFFEALKWRYMIRKIEKISIFRSVRAVFTGITVSSFTPNRVGEYGGRVFCLEKGDRIQAVFITVLCSMAQLLTTIIFGSISFFVLSDYVFLDNSILEIFNFKIPFFSFYILVFFNLLFIISYFNISFFVNLIKQFKLFNNSQSYIEVLSMYSFRDLFITLIFSIVRYFIFSLQFILLLDIFGVDVSFFDAVFAVMLVFFFITITPTITIAEIGVRGSVAIFIIGFFSPNSLGILSSTCTLWLINLIIPAIIGSFFIFSLKFFRTS